MGKYYFINLCVSPIYEAGQKDSQVHSYNENLQSTFLKMLKCNFAMFSIWQASTWQTSVLSYFDFLASSILLYLARLDISVLQFGHGNPFLMFLCLACLLEHRDTIIKTGKDYQDIAMYFDKLVRSHDVRRSVEKD